MMMRAISADDSSSLDFDTIICAGAHDTTANTTLLAFGLLGMTIGGIWPNYALPPR